MSSLRQVLLQCKLGIQCHYTYSMMKFVPIPGLDLLGIIQKKHLYELSWDAGQTCRHIEREWEGEGGGGGGKWRFGDGEGVRAPPYDHMADYPGSTWHLPISVRTNITRFECPIRIGYTNSQLRGVPLKPYDAFWVDLLAHSFEQSFFLHQKHAWWDVTLFL